MARVLYAYFQAMRQTSTSQVVVHETRYSPNSFQRPPEDILRNEKGFAERVGVNEPGEVIHRILDQAAPTSSWNGYLKNAGAEEKRYLRDVFEKGDM